jgi:hypothetical protein
MALRYWVGGTNTWNATVGTKWALTSGGVGGQAAPVATDDVFFDAKPAPNWIALTVTTLTTNRCPLVGTGNGYYYECTTAGTTGATEPTWPTTAGNTVVDGSVTWTCRLATVTYGVTASVLSVNFTGYIGEFSFQNSLSYSSTLTLGANTTYTTPGASTVYTISIGGTAPGLVANGKILPTNLTLNLTLNGILTITGNADFGGNLGATTTAHTIKSAVGFPVDLRIGGNMTINATTTNPNDYVAIKLYGTSKTFGGAGTNCRVSFVNGSTYTSSTNVGIGGTSFLTVDTGGRFNAVSTNFLNNSGSLTISGFNGLSDFFGLHNGFAITLATDTIIKSKVEFSNTSSTIASAAPGTAKLLLEGNLTSAGNAALTIDRLEFSGTTASNITSTSAGTLQIKDFIINKTGAGSLNFLNAGAFSLFVPSNTTYLFTHTQGAVTQGVNNIIRFIGNNTASITSFSANPSLTTLRYIEVYGGQLSLNTQLTVTTLLITPFTTPTTITSPSTFGFTVEELRIINVSGASRTVTLKSGVTYTVTGIFFAFTTNPALPTALNASTVGTKAKLNVEYPGAPNVEYVNATDIDSSGTNGVLPFTKVPIYSLGGTLSNTFNWIVGAQPPPVLPSRTVAYTFVN